MTFTQIACIIANVLIILGFTGGLHGWVRAYRTIIDKSSTASQIERAAERFWDAGRYIFLIIVFIFFSMFIEITQTQPNKPEVSQWTK